MKYGYILLLAVLCSFTLVIKTQALEIAKYASVSLAETTTQRSTNCKAVLGDPKDENSFAHLLQDIFDVIKFATPILVLALTIVEYAKVIASSDKDQIVKANKKTIQRIVWGVVLFCIPILLNYLFDLLGMYGTCGIS